MTLLIVLWSALVFDIGFSCFVVYKLSRDESEEVQR